MSETAGSRRFTLPGAVTRVLRWLSLAVTRLVLALVVTWVFLTDPGFNGFFAATFESMLAGTAWKPYVYRALVPTILHTVAWTLESAGPWFTRQFRRDAALRYVAGRTHVDPKLALELCLFMVLSAACFFAFAGSIRRSCRRLYEGPVLFADCVGFAALCGLPFLFAYTSYVYDPATLLLSALAIEMLVAERFRALLLVAIVGFFNKETMVLFVPLLAIHAFRKTTFRQYVVLVGAGVAAFAWSRVLLNHWYGDNFGYYTIFQLVDHNLKLLRVYPLSTFVAWLLVALSVFGHWSMKPRLLKAGLLCHLPLIGACLLWGFFDELRDYYEMYAIVVLTMAPTIGAVFGYPVVVAPALSPAHAGATLTDTAANPRT